MKKTTKFKKIPLGHTFTVPKQKDVLYKKISKNKAIPFSTYKVGKETTFAAKTEVYQN